MKAGSPVIKARLVARGFEEELNSEVLVDSPTCSKDAFRLALSIVSAKGWNCNSMDVKSAFLQGHPIKREVLILPPDEFYNGQIWRLKKTVYGLNDAARAWYERVKQELLTLGMSMCSLEPALFYWHNAGQLEGIICIHVDDFYWSATPTFHASIMSQLENPFLIGSETASNTLVLQWSKRRMV